MIILGLIMILAGSCAGAIILWLKGASLWEIVLAYVAGGWAGLLLGLPVVLMVQQLCVYRARLRHRAEPARRDDKTATRPRIRQRIS